MKTLIFTLMLLGVSAQAGTVYVYTYCKHDGKCVRGHYRTTIPGMKKAKGK